MRHELTTLDLNIDSPELEPLIAMPYQLERLATGFRWAEGPIWFPDGDFVLWSDIPNDTIHRWSEQDGLGVFRKPCGFTNGHTLDAHGRLVSCEHQNRRVSRTEHDGTVTAVATHYEGKRLNSPNDVVIRSDGMIFFTDPTYGMQAHEGNAGPQELDWQGVYCVQPDGSGLTLLTREFTQPNGLALSVDERTLYVDDSQEDLLRAFDLGADGQLSSGRLVAEHIREEGVAGGPDGVKIDVEGRIWITAPGGIRVYLPDGTLLGTLPIPENTANLNWGGEDRRTLYITASTSLYRVRLNVAGSGLWTHMA
jgi:gluconolactonase